MSMDLTYRMTFGKFKGETLETIAENHTWYLSWLIGNVDWLLKKMRGELSSDDKKNLS